MNAGQLELNWHMLTKERITMREKTEFHHTSTALPLLRTLVILSTKNKIVRLFIDMGLGFSTSKAEHRDAVNGFEIGLKPGLAIKLNDSFSFITKVGFAGYRDDYFRGSDGFGVTLDGENISIGIDYEF